MIKSDGIGFIRGWMDWDTHDVWGCVQAARFDLAEAWYVFSQQKAWGFSPCQTFSEESLGFRGNEFLKAMRDGLVTFRDAEYWMGVLDRMRDLVIKAGRDY